MAVTKTILKLAERDVVIKVAGGAGTSTIAIRTDLKRENEQIVGTATASIAGLQWTGTSDAVVSIVRNDVTIMTLNCGAAGALEMNGQMMIPDSIQHDKDIVINITGAAAELYLRLKKTSGYVSGYEPSEYGQYDDPNRIGASTTVPGSPDYIAP